MKLKYFLPSIIICLILHSCVEQGYKEPSSDAEALYIDGSSTVYPITNAVVDQYKRDTNNFIISLKVSGTGGGFEKFAKGEIQINNASRLIKETEKQLCLTNDVIFKRFDVAFDGIAVVVNSENQFIDYLTTEELKKVWSNNTEIAFWSDIRKEWPHEEIKLYGPGDNSGTHDYFRETILEEKEFRSGLIKSENDNLLVRGILNSPYSMGFFGLSYYENNKKNLKIVPIDNGNGPIVPNSETIKNKYYNPLSRTMYLYVNEEFLTSKSGSIFIKYYLSYASDLSKKVGYIPLSDENYVDAINNL